MNRVLVVYNTCGLLGRNNTDWYIDAIDTILRQKYNNFVVAVSGCCLLDDAKKKLRKLPVVCNFIDDVYPVNVTFNHTVKSCANRFGDFHSYLYLDSGMKMFSLKRGRDEDIISTMVGLMTERRGIVSAQTDTDNGFEHWLGFSKIDTDFTMPIGKACNSHVTLYSDKLFKAYDGRLMPDIFASTCFESVMTFVCAAIGLNWVISGSLVLPHRLEIDGASSGFINRANSWDHTFHSKKSLTEIISNHEAWESGFGYEENRGVLKHNKECYRNKRCRNPDRLYKFIRDNLYCTLDYAKIKSEFYANL